MEKFLRLVNGFSLLLLASSVGVFVSSLVNYRVSLNSSVHFSNISCKKKSLSYDILVEREGFFKPVEKLKPKTTTLEGTVSLNDYKLKGTVVNNPSLAILEKGKSTKILYEGDYFEGFKLKKIYPDRVVFSKNGKDVVLMLIKINQEKLKSSNRVVDSRGGNRFFVKRSEILEEISSGKFLRYINIVPVQNPPGLKVNYVNRNSFIYKLGIRPGDVIISINDIRIKTPEDSFSAFEKLKNADSITITVLRGGREEKLHYELE